MTESRKVIFYSRIVQKFNISLALLIILFNQSVWSQDISSSAGTASILLLRFGSSPRVAGLANAFTGLADDENSLFFNAAGLSNMTSNTFSLNHTEWFEDIRIDNISFGYNLSRRFSTGVGFTHMWMPDIVGFDDTGQSTGSINVSSSVSNLAISYKINPIFSFGLGLKYFQDNLADYRASGIAFDFGILVKNVFSGFSTGFSVQNLGGEVRYDEENQKIPLTFRGGVAYKIYSSNILFTLDVTKAIDTDVQVLIGTEYILINQFSIRLGNRFTKSDNFTPSIGAGFHFKKNFNLFYTFTNYSNLGGTHRLGFSYRFGHDSKTIDTKLLYTESQPIRNIPPEFIDIKIDGNVLIVSWNRVHGVRYNVYAKHSYNNKWIKLNKVPLYNNSLKYKKPLALGIYTFRICSVYDDKESAFSEEVTIDVK